MNKRLGLWSAVALGAVLLSGCGEKPVTSEDLANGTWHLEYSQVASEDVATSELGTIVFDADFTEDGLILRPDEEALDELFDKEIAEGELDEMSAAMAKGMLIGMLEDEYEYTVTEGVLELTNPRIDILSADEPYTLVREDDRIVMEQKDAAAADGETGEMSAVLIPVDEAE